MVCIEILNKDEVEFVSKIDIRGFAINSYNVLYECMDAPKTT